MGYNVTGVYPGLEIHFFGGSKLLQVQDQVAKLILW